MNGISLQGKGIVVTRPRAQAGEMLTLLQAQGARPILFPAVQIEAPENWQSLDDALHQLGAYDWVIFSSRNAVAFALSRLQSRNLSWPTGPRIAAVGRETPRRCVSLVCRSTWSPRGSAPRVCWKVRSCWLCRDSV